MDAVGDFEHMRHIVRDQHDRQTALLDVEDQLQHPARFLDAERSRRLVHDDDAAAERGGARHRDALALAAGQRLHRLVDVLNGQEPKFGELLAGDLLHGAAIEQPKNAAENAGGAHFTPEKDIVGDRQRRRHRKVLIDRLDPGLTRGDRRTEMDDLSRQPDFAGIGNDGAAQSFDHRRFAGPIVADHREDFAGIEVEIRVVERGHAPIAFDEAARLQNRRCAQFDTLRIH